MSSFQKSRKEAFNQANLRWRYLLFITLLFIAGPTTHFISQYLRGYPLDIHYFWSELSPEAIFNSDLHNGPGGADWKIGKALATSWNASNFRSLPESREFALQLVNRDRTINKLSPLVEDPLLSKAAQLHAEDMLKRRYFDHVSPEGTKPRDRFMAVGGSSRMGVGENILQSKKRTIGLTYQKLEEFQKGWMYSNGHRANVLDSAYTRFGYGIVVGPLGQTYAVQMFAVPEPK
ncbi:MAG TPA: CAP domain-containing protein, partial [Coleofasciculaceae cyanobacterium]